MTVSGRHPGFSWWAESRGRGCCANVLSLQACRMTACRVISIGFLAHMPRNHNRFSLPLFIPFSVCLHVSVMTGAKKDIDRGMGAAW
jgi:hypothetical protein